MFVYILRCIPLQKQGKSPTNPSISGFPAASLTKKLCAFLGNFENIFILGTLFGQYMPFMAS